MKRSKEEILTALRIIQDECLEHDNCDGTCPFSMGPNCLISKKTPNKWVINDETRQVWKGLL